MILGRQIIGRHCFVWGLLLLSVAVFNWGLQYKMSLYQSASGSNPPAKFWTGRSDAGETLIEASSQQKPSSVNPGLSVLLCLFLLTSRAVQCSPTLRRLPPTGFIDSAQTLAHYRALFLRPPPAHQLKFS